MRKAWPRARAGLQTEGGDPSGGGRDARCRTRALWGVKEQEKDGERFCPGVKLGGEQPSGWETLEGAQTQGESSPSTMRLLNETPLPWSLWPPPRGALWLQPWSQWPRPGEATLAGGLSFCTPENLILGPDLVPADPSRHRLSLARTSEPHLRKGLSRFKVLTALGHLHGAGGEEGWSGE